jgi:methionyl-tRNA formyltransferase
MASNVESTVPIHTHATSLNLPTHSFDTFTKWTPSSPLSLIIAVSFGLLIPPRILNLSVHGGINLHPSLLPDLRGPAPIEHAILRRRTCTGVSVQTLHPTQFDRGVVLAQTPAPGIEIEQKTTAEELEERLAGVGADMLVDVLKKGTYASPHEGVETWYDGPMDHAPKITKEDRHVTFAGHALEDVLAMQRALGDIWCVLPDGERLIMHQVASAGTEERFLEGKEAGLWVQEGVEELLFKAKCGGVGKVLASTYAGGKKGRGNAKVRRLLSDAGKLCG